MTDIYQTPSAQLNETTNVNGDDHGSLETGIKGDYELSIGDILNEAWDKTKGSKLTLVLSCVIYTSFNTTLNIGLTSAATWISPENAGETFSLTGALIFMLQQTILVFLTTPLTAALYILGVKRSVGAPISVSMMFSYFLKILPLALTVLISYAMLALGFVLLVIPMIYLLIAYSLALLLVIDKDLSPWQALEASRKAITHHWFTIFGLYLVLSIILLISMIPFLIGLIWSMPLVTICVGIVYRKIFGIEPSTLES